MPFTILETKTYGQAPDVVYQASLGAIRGLEGKVRNQDDAERIVEAQFDKKILGKTLGDRTYLKVEVSAEESGQSRVAIEAYPLDPVGRKLMFGARKGVTRTVVDWFVAHLEHRLPS